MGLRARIAEAKATLTKASPNPTLYVKHENGALHTLSGARAKKLRSELAAGRGGKEVTALTMNGYIGFLNDAGNVEDFESLTAAHIK